MGPQPHRGDVDTAGVVRLHPALTRVVVQVSQLSDAQIEAEVDQYVCLIRTPTTAPTAGPERLAG